MRICPLTLDECNKIIELHVETAFIMAPSKDNSNKELEKVLNQIKDILSGNNYNFIEGSEVIDYGDYLCSICKNILGSSFGIMLLDKDVINKTIGNIFWETGLMSGFGKPVIQILDNKSNLSSDFVRNFTIFYNDKNYLDKFIKLFERIINLREYYSNVIAKVSLEAEDYEKAIWYIKEAYLIGGQEEDLNILKTIKETIANKEDVAANFKKRIVEDISKFIR
jgi:hypothetical protein